MPPAQAPAAPIGKRILVPTPDPITEGSAPRDGATVDAAPAAPDLVDTSLTPEQAALLAKLPSRGAAPELANETWFNSEPLKLADLRGNVVIVEFWTYG